MMNFNLNTYLNILSLVAMGVIAIYVVRSKIKDENLKDLKERVEILERERKLTEVDRDKERQAFRKELVDYKESSQYQHIDNQKAIANLEGQLQTYKDIPLRRIDESLALLAVSNKNILKVLEGSAVIAAKDRNTLLNPKQHIGTQEVETQIIKEKL